MKHSMLLIIRILIILLILITLSNYVFASDEVIKGAKDFLKKGDKSTLDSSSIKQVSDSIYNILAAVGGVIAVIVGAILGIQFMFGSIEEKVKVKESLIPFLIGTVIIFGAFGIWRLMIILTQNI